MNYESKSTPEILIAPKNKPIQPPPARPEEKPAQLCDMTKDELIEYAANRLIGLPIDWNQYRKDTAYKTAVDKKVIEGIAAYAMLGLRDIGFPINAFLEDNQKKLEALQIKKRILG